MGKQHRGFIPLVAIILLGLTAVVGGAAATIYVRGGPAVQELPAVPEEVVDLGSVSPQTATSTAPATVETPGEEKVAEEAQSLPTKVEVKIAPETLAICVEILKEEIDTSKRSLSEDIRVLCEGIKNGRYQEGEQLDRAVEWLHDKWELWLKTRGRTE